MYDFSHHFHTTLYFATPVYIFSSFNKNKERTNDINNNNNDNSSINKVLAYLLSC